MAAQNDVNSIAECM